MKVYYATFSINNGQTYTPKAWEYTNLKKACKEIRNKVASERLLGNNAKWEVMHYDNECPVIDYAGEIRYNGQKIIYHN